MIGALSPDMSLSTDTCACKRLEKKGLQPAQMTSPSLPGILHGKSPHQACQEFYKAKAGSIPCHLVLYLSGHQPAYLLRSDPEPRLGKRSPSPLQPGSVLTLHAPPCSSSPRIRRSLQLGCSCRCPHAILTTLLSPI